MEIQKINQGYRFILEILALLALAYWGWNTSTGIMRYVLVVLAPFIAASLWASFRVKEEAHDHPIIEVTGPVRLTTEITLFAASAVLLHVAGQTLYAAVFAGMVLLHYAIDYRRVGRLLT